MKKRIKGFILNTSIILIYIKKTNLKKASLSLSLSQVKYMYIDCIKAASQHQ